MTGITAEEKSQLAKSYNSEKAKSMLYSIKNKEMAIAAAKWIAQQLPLGLYTVFLECFPKYMPDKWANNTNNLPVISFLGEEKIDILKTCVDLAMAWKSSCSQKVIFFKIEYKYPACPHFIIDLEKTSKNV